MDLCVLNIYLKSISHLLQTLGFHISIFNIFQIPVAAHKEVEEEEEREVISEELETHHVEGELNLCIICLNFFFNFTLFVCTTLYQRTAYQTSDLSISLWLYPQTSSPTTFPNLLRLWFFFLKIWAYLPVWKTAYFLSCCVCLHSMLKTAYSNVLYLFPSSKCSPHISLKCLRYQRGMSLKKESLFLSQKKLHLLKVLLLPKFKKKKNNNLTIFQYIFVSCLECFYEYAIYVPFILHYLLSLPCAVPSLQCLNVSQCWLFSFLIIFFVSCVCFGCVFFADKSRIFSLQ